MQGPPRSGTIKVANGQLSYDVAGTGPPIVFIHAGIADRRMWSREFDRYSRDHTVLRYDRRGFGSSAAATTAYSDVDDLRAFVDLLRLGPPTVVACSNGGAIALDLAVEHPTAVRSLLLVAPGVSGFDGSSDPEGNADYAADSARMKPIFAAWTEGRKEEALRGMVQYWCSQQTGANLELVRAMVRDNAEEIFTDASARHNRGLDPPALPRLSSVRVPVKVLAGDHDEPTCGWIARRVAREIPGAELVPVPGADHLVNLAQPEAFDRALRNLL